MRKAKRTILIAMLICAGFVPVCSAGTARGRPKPPHPTALELLDKYAETQNKLKSFILKTQTSRKGKSSTAAMGKFSTDYSYEYELRFDGNRASLRRNLWGKLNARLNLTKDEALYQSRLWDGETSFRYHRSANNQRLPLGSVTITRIEEENNKRKTFKNCVREFTGRSSRGYFPADTDRIDTILRKADTISVRDEMENIGGSNCYVIEADTKRGEYTVWIDPSHGYHIVKATAKRGAGNVVAPRNYKLTGPETRFFLLENVRFTKVDDVWVPVEADLAYGSTYYGDNCFDNSKIHQKVTKIILNPDHDALGSFAPDDILNGAKVEIVQVPDISYIWQDGKVVDEKGRVIMDCRPKKASGSAESKPKSAVRKRPSAWELLRRYATQQAKVTAPRSKERVVHFPKDRSIGWLFLVERPLPKDCLWHEVLVWERERLSEAQGDVRVPADKMLRLDVGKNAWKGGRPFAGLKPDDIQILNFGQYPHAGDSVLKDVARLTGLEELFFWEGNFTERGLKHLTVLKQLKALTLPGRIHSRGLTYLSKLPSLEYLCFGGPMVTDAKMVHIGRLTSLTQLSIAGSKVGKGLAHLKGLKSLRFLSLAAKRNEHIDKHLAHLAELTNIEELDLGDTLVGDAGLEHLKGMIKLKKLDIGNRYYPVSHKITDAGMVHLNNLKSLEELELPHTGVTDIGLAQLAGLNALKKLNVGRGVTDEGMASLAKMKSLEDLDISSPHVTDAGMEKLAECPCLESLTLKGCQITNAGLAHLAKLKTLTKLSLRRTKVTGSGLTVLKELPLLTEFNVHYIDFGEAGMANLAGLKSLERLWIDAPEGKITDDDLADLSRVTSLKNLQISIRDSSQSLITNEGLAHLANLKALESLNIHSCQKVTDAGLRHFEGLAYLKRLRLDFSRITKAGIARLKARIPGVEVIVQRPVPRRNARPKLPNRPTRTMQRRSGRNEAKSREGC